MTSLSRSRILPPRPTGRTWWAVVLWGAVLILGATVSADTVSLRSGKEKKLVRVRGIRGGKLYYSGTANREMSSPIGEIERIEVARVPGLNSAEREFAAGRYEQALKAYERFLGGAASDWQLWWARYRILGALDHLGEFARTVDTYCLLVDETPEYAALLTPSNWPDASSTFYDDALAILERALRGTTDERVLSALRELELRVRYKKEGHLSTGGADPEALGNPDPSAIEPNSEAGDPEVVRHVALVAEAFDRRAFVRAVELADDVLPETTDEQAARVLLLRGKALFHRASSREEYLQAGLSLMRVVIHLGDSDSAAEAGYYAALAMERAGEPAQAAALLGEARSRAGDDQALKRKIGNALQRVR